MAIISRNFLRFCVFLKISFIIVFVIKIIILSASKSTNMLVLIWLIRKIRNELNQFKTRSIVKIDLIFNFLTTDNAAPSIDLCSLTLIFVHKMMYYFLLSSTWRFWCANFVEQIAILAVESTCSSTRYIEPRPLPFHHFPCTRKNYAY